MVIYIIIQIVFVYEQLMNQVDETNKTKKKYILYPTEVASYLVYNSYHGNTKTWRIFYKANVDIKIQNYYTGQPLFT
jgi:hypothetical protein